MWRGSIERTAIDPRGDLRYRPAAIILRLGHGFAPVGWLGSGQGGPVARRSKRSAQLLATGLAALLLSGCSLAPKSFQGIRKPEPLVRARAIPLGRNLPEQKVVPGLIASLDDRDQVVRMAASEELKKRSGKDFGFVPYAEAEDRAPAVSRWQSWWDSHAKTLGKLRPKRVRRYPPESVETR